MITLHLSNIPRAMLASAIMLAQAVQAQSITLGTTTLEAYKPFTVTVQFAAPHCINPQFPLVAQTSYRAGEYSVVLSHVKSGPCRNSFELTIPGLPHDVRSLRVAVTRPPSHAAAPAEIAESVSRAISVSMPNGLGALARMFTARVESDGVFDPFSAPAGSGLGPVVLWPFSAEPLTGSKWMVETQDPSGDEAYTFKYFKRVGTAIPLGFTPLYSINYPAPYRGVFYTIDFKVLEDLARAWGRQPPNRDGGVGLVGKLEHGACPVGMTPVYQAFFSSATEVAHRYTQRPETYRALIANGYAGEGPQWCAPER